MSLDLIGREAEIHRLERVYNSPEAEFVVLYGRRRVGKTFLIRRIFQNKACVYFEATGLQNAPMEKQISNFADALSETFSHGVPIAEPDSWDSAFKMLNVFIENAPRKKVVIFLDELPWMATPRSGLLAALDYYWNHYWSQNPNLTLVVCGSSASWLIKRIIYNQGGLHNRCTCELQLSPYTLADTKNYLASKGVKLSNRQILQLYMTLGGIPYYLRYVEPGKSASENIQHIILIKKHLCGMNLPNYFIHYLKMLKLISS